MKYSPKGSAIIVVKLYVLLVRSSCPIRHSFHGKKRPQKKSVFGGSRRPKIARIFWEIRSSFLVLFRCSTSHTQQHASHKLYEASLPLAKMPPPAFQFRGKRNGEPRARPEFTFRSRPTPASRPLLVARRERTPELIGNAENDQGQAKKFHAIEDLTDSEEVDMDISSAEEEEDDDDDGDDDQPPRKKRAIEATTDDAGEASSQPKWSNPDPYTVLPPQDEGRGKKVDFVKLIRKARIASAVSKPDDNNAVASNEDFISLGAADLGTEQPPDSAPRGPRRFERGDGGDGALGNRKRTYDDEIIAPLKKISARDKRCNSDGSILHIWRALPRQDPAPWVNQDSPSTFHVGTM